MYLGGILWILVVVAGWAFLFGLMFYFVSTISHGRDVEETVCPLPEETPAPTTQEAQVAF